MEIAPARPGLGLDLVEHRLEPERRPELELELGLATLLPGGEVLLGGLRWEVPECGAAREWADLAGMGLAR